MNLHEKSTSLKTVQRKYIEYKSGKHGVSEVWKYFLREENGLSAKCNLCNEKKVDKFIQCTQYSTKGLITHLKTCHNLDIFKRTVTEHDPVSEAKGSSERPQKITKFFTTIADKTLDAVLCRMTALDGLPFSVFCTSTDLRDALRAKGFTDLPSSHTTIRNKVVSYAKALRSEQRKSLQALITTGSRFALTLDEWTSNRNRRYLNVNIHSIESHNNLGLIRASGKFPAEKIKELLEIKLSQFGLSLKTDIIAITTDGPNVMKKLGRIVESEQQLCFAHGIQLAVLDLLYDTRNKNLLENEGSDVEDVVTGFTGYGELAAESEEDDENIQEFVFSSTEGEVNHNIKPLIMKVRKVVKLFRKSSTRNDSVLQKHIKNDYGKESVLILDCKTRWSSLYAMLKRFYEVKGSIQKSLIDLNYSDTISEDEFNDIKGIVDSLEPVKLTVEALCRRDATLITADAALKFMLCKLDSQNTKIAKQLKSCLLNRIRERRTCLSQALLYLHSGMKNSKDNSLQEKSDINVLFSMASNKDITAFLVKILKRLIISQHNPPQIQVDDSNTLDPAPEDNIDIVMTHEQVKKKNLSLQEELNQAIQESEINNPNILPPQSSTLLSNIKKEMSLLQATGTRGLYLNLAYNALITVPPTSVESERAFSSSGLLCTKIRSNLGDETLDYLCALRAHFQLNR